MFKKNYPKENSYFHPISIFNQKSQVYCKGLLECFLFPHPILDTNPFTSHTSHSSFHVPYFTLLHAHPLLHTPPCTSFTSHSSLHNPSLISQTLHSILHSPFFTLPSHPIVHTPPFPSYASHSFLHIPYFTLLP